MSIVDRHLGTWWISHSSLNCIMDHLDANIQLYDNRGHKCLCTFWDIAAMFMCGPHVAMHLLLLKVISQTECQHRSCQGQPDPDRIWPPTGRHGSAPNPQTWDGFLHLYLLLSWLTSLLCHTSLLSYPVGQTKTSCSCKVKGNKSALQGTSFFTSPRQLWGQLVAEVAMGQGRRYPK